VILRWKPEPGAEPVELSFKPYEMLSPEAELIESIGMGTWDTWDGWHRLFRQGHKRAERVALWITRRRTEPTLTLEDVVVRMDGLSVHFDTDEIRTRRQELRELPFDENWTPETLEATLAIGYLQLPEGEVDVPLPQSVEPNDTTPTPLGAPATDSPSATT
jgi:hypothetical protein